MLEGEMLLELAREAEPQFAHGALKDLHISKISGTWESLRPS
jgi:hypothetical protein